MIAGDSSLCTGPRALRKHSSLDVRRLGRSRISRGDVALVIKELQRRRKL